MVFRFLQGQTSVKAEDIVKLMYEHCDSVPKVVQSMAECPASAVIHPDEKPMAWSRLKEWAVKTVEGIIHKEANVMASKDGGLHLPKQEAIGTSFTTFPPEV
jgi:hypothetical protein